MASKFVFFIIFLGIVQAARCRVNDNMVIGLAGDPYQFACDDSLDRRSSHEARISLNNLDIFKEAFDYNLAYNTTLYSFDNGARVVCHKRDHPDQLVVRDDVLVVLPDPDTRCKSEFADQFDPDVVITSYLSENETYWFECRHPRGRKGDSVAVIVLKGPNYVLHSYLYDGNLPLLTLQSLASASCLICLSYTQGGPDAYYKLRYSRQIEEVVILKPKPAPTTTTKSVGEDYIFTCDRYEATRITTNDLVVFFGGRYLKSPAVKYTIKVQSFDNGTVAKCRDEGVRTVDTLVVRPRLATESDEFEPGVVHKHEIQEYESYEFVCNKVEDATEVAWIKVDANNVVRVGHFDRKDIRRNMTLTYDEFDGAKLVCASYSKHAIYDAGEYVADHYIRRIDKVVLFKRPGADEAAVSPIVDTRSGTR